MKPLTPAEIENAERRERWPGMSIKEKIAECKKVKAKYPDCHKQVECIEQQIREFNK
jgi:hypothetical protein